MASSSLTSYVDKPLAIVFYQEEIDEAFNLNEKDTRARIELLSKAYSVNLYRVSTIFEAEKYAGDLHRKFGRKFDYLEFAGHGDRESLTFKKNVRGGTIAINSPKNVLDSLQRVIKLVADRGIIITQSCENALRVGTEWNLSLFLTKMTTASQRVIGSTVKQTTFELYPALPRHIHLRYNLTNQDVTRIFTKQVDGVISRITIEWVDILFSEILRSDDPAVLESCYELIAAYKNPDKSRKIIEANFPDLLEKLETFLEGMTISRQSNFVSSNPKLIEMLDDLERLGDKIGSHQAFYSVVLSPKNREGKIHVDPKGLGPHNFSFRGPYLSTYQFILGLAGLCEYLPFISYFDNKKEYNDNPAGNLIYKISEQVLHTGSTSLIKAELFLRDLLVTYEVIKKNRGDFALVDFFKSGMGSGCLNARMNTVDGFFKKYETKNSTFLPGNVSDQDILEQVYEKCLPQFRQNILDKLEISENPSDIHHLNYYKFHFNYTQPNLIKFIGQVLEANQIPKNKFSEDEILELSRVYFFEYFLILDKTLRAFTEDMVRQQRPVDIYGIREHIPLSKMELAQIFYLKYPTNYCEHFKGLNFSIEEVIEFFIYYKFTDINLRGFNINGALLVKLAQNNLNITALAVESDAITDHAVEYLMRTCKKLKSLIIGPCSNLTAQTVLAIANYGQQIESLDLWGSLFKADAMQILKDRCVNLRHLGLTYYNASEDVIREIIESLAVIKVTKINMSRFSRDFNLSNINLENPLMIEVFKRCPGLVSLDLNRNYRLEDSLVLTLAQHCPNLENVNFEECESITDSSIISLTKRCRKLKNVNLTKCYGDCGMVFSLTDRSMNALSKNCPELKTLKIDYCVQYSVSALKRLISSCTSLEELHIKYSGETKKALVEAANSGEVYAPNVKVYVSEGSYVVFDTLMLTPITPLKDDVDSEECRVKRLLPSGAMTANRIKRQRK